MNKSSLAIWICCYCGWRKGPFLIFQWVCAYCNWPHRTLGFANWWYWDAESAAYAGKSTPRPGAMMWKEAGTKPVVGFEYERAYSGLPWATPHDRDAPKVVSIKCTTKALQPVPSTKSLTALRAYDLSTLGFFLRVLLRALFGALLPSFATQESGQKRYADIKPENISHLHYGKCENPLSMAECPVCDNNLKGRSHFAETAKLSSKCKILDSRYGSRRTQWAHYGRQRHRQRASNQHQSSNATLHRGLRHLHSSSILFSGYCRGRNSERHQNKIVLIPLFFVTYPNFASAALPNMGCDALHQQVPCKKRLTRIRIT